MRRIFRFLPWLPWWWLRYKAGLRPRTPQETFATIVLHTRRKPRRSPGAFELSFGRFRYPDALAFRYQFLEICLDRAYDFDTTAKEPRILDCGANAGLATVHWKQQYPNACVQAFEADPSIAALLRENVASLGLTNVHVSEGAVTDQAGTVGFAIDGADGGHIDEESSCTVPAIRLADEIQQRVELLKLDIEGAEYRVIEDLARTGALDHVQRMICEFHVKPGDPGALESSLLALRHSGLRTAIANARSGGHLLAKPAPTPFRNVESAAYLLLTYAWRNDA